MRYCVRLVETKSYDVFVDADSKNDAVIKVKEMWFENDYEKKFNFRSSYIDNSKTKVINYEL